MTAHDYEEEVKKIQNHLKDMFLRMREAGKEIGAFEPRFNPAGASKGWKTKDKWVIYRDAKSAYKSLWLNYQKLFEENLLDDHSL